MKLGIFIIVAIALFSGPVAHAESEQNCRIRVAMVETGGRKSTVIFNTHLNSAQECRRLAQIHQPNFEPDKVRSKKVGYKWLSRLAKR